ncbi:MAG: pyridine nucleotide-disulfide oxidoreductase [Streptosporangiales bacterium]|nr:pyridine nucleotide-disulfide oxidoreductase [Streptosporangiales bacterium]
MHAIVVGGSMGGLIAGLVLRDVGCDVTVLERSRVTLEGRGAGIVLHPSTIRYLTHEGLYAPQQIGAPARKLRYLRRDGSVASEQPCSYRFISYFWLYEALLTQFGRDRYHLGHELAGFEQDADGVTVHLTEGGSRRCDLLVCADGIHSTARGLLLPQVSPSYAGYVGWRGTVSEAQLTGASFGALHEAITYHLLRRGHILAYPIPDFDGSVSPARWRRTRHPTLEPGHRLTNWVWYRNVTEGPELDDLLTDSSGVRRSVSVAPGAMQEHHVKELREVAARDLPPSLAEMLTKTAEPFVQVVFDIEVPRMAFGRVCLIGDAAFALRPHAAAGTAKAAEDAWKLAEALEACSLDVERALMRWEPGQLALGRSALGRTRDAGNRVQMEGTWRDGEPLPFGLYETGDSALLTPYSR